MEGLPKRREDKGEVKKMVDKSQIGKNKVLGNYIYFLKNGGGIHGKFKNWKDGDPEREPAFAYIFRKEVKPGMAVIDAGANLGYYSLVAAQIMNGNGKVYAIEPDPDNVFLLNKAVSLNAYDTPIIVYPAALSNKNGQLTFHTAKASNLSSIAKTEHSTGVIEVEGLTLSKFAWNKRVIDKAGKEGVFLRMDIEGYEVEALEGAMTFLKKDFPCKILMEIHPQFYDDEHNLIDVFNKLIKFGFNTKYVVSAGIAQPDMFKKFVYRPIKIFDCGRFERGLYDCVSNEAMIIMTRYGLRQYFNEEMIKRSGEKYTDKIVRAVMLERS